jgi:tripartite-type tricarboxylate transporter receptor subunit TctC
MPNIFRIKQLLGFLRQPDALNKLGEKMNVLIAVSRLLVAVCAAISMVPTHAAENYPVKPIKLVVGYPAGGIVDARARVIADMAGAELGQKIVVDNRPGVSGTIGAEAVAKSPPDGYTLLFGTTGELALAPALGQKIGYDPDTSFVGISGLNSGHFALFVSSSLGVKTLAEFIALAKSKPGTIGYGSGGNASMQHFLTDLFSKKAGIELNHTPYKGEAPAITDLLGGHIQAIFGAFATMQQHLKSGKVLPLATAAAKRSVSLPDVPTFQESGVAGMDIPAWTGILAPTGTPREIIAKLNEVIVKVRNSPEFAKLPGIEDTVNIAGPPDAFAAFMKGERARWVRLVKETGIKLE